METPFVESGHFVFSLNARNAEYRIQKMGAVIDPAKDIQYGANTSTYCCDKWMNVSDGDHSIAFFPKDTPLLSMGENRIYIYSKDYKPEKPVLYWNAFNNQWGTNFPQWIGGNFRYEYRIYPYKGLWNNAEISKMAEEYATPLCIIKEDSEYHLLDEAIENATVLCFKSAEDGNGHILRLIENRGNSGEVWIKLTAGLGIYALCDLLEKDIEMLKGTPREVIIKTAPFEVHTLRIRTCKILSTTNYLTSSQKGCDIK